MRPRPAYVAALVAVGSLALAACGTPNRPAAVHVEPLVNFALPPASAGCGGATALAGGAERLPITVSTVAGQVAESVNVCIGGRGPYPFIIDSGAGESIIDSNLANRLHLEHDGAPSRYQGVGCTSTAQPVVVNRWSVDGVDLAGQLLSAATVPGFGTPGEPVGLLGSDVLSRFGSVRIDFAPQTLTLGGPEGAPSRIAVVHGPTGPPPPTVLTQGQPGITVPLTVSLSPGDVSLYVRLRFSKRPAHFFVVDTGSSQSVVSTSLAQRDDLARTDLAQRQTTVCSTITVPLVQSGPWSIPGAALRPQLLGATSFGPISANGTAGLLGSDQLQRFGWVIFDYTGARMVLG